LAREAFIVGQSTGTDDQEEYQTQQHYVGSILN
jgi:hypothetical protein